MCFVLVCHDFILIHVCVSLLCRALGVLLRLTYRLSGLHRQKKLVHDVFRDNVKKHPDKVSHRSRVAGWDASGQGPPIFCFTGIPFSIFVFRRILRFYSLNLDKKILIRSGLKIKTSYRLNARWILMLPVGRKGTGIFLPWQN